MQMLSQKTTISSKFCSQIETLSEKISADNPLKFHCFSENFTISQEIGKGTFGIIYKVIQNRNSSKIYAAKIAPKPSEDAQSDLEKEARIMHSLILEEGFPKIESFHAEFDKEILVMSLLGKNLKTLLNQCGGKFSIKTGSLLALQVLRRIEALHNKGFLHMDLKPENIVMGANSNDEKTAYLIDFGLSEKFLDSQGKHLPFRKNQKMAGTLYFLSAYGHQGIKASRRDDLISLGYLLVHFFKGDLPWRNLSGNKQERLMKLFQMKCTISIEILCQDLPSEISEYMNYVLSLSFNQKPDYDYLKRLFKKVLDNLGAWEDGNFDWVENQGINLKGRQIHEEGFNRFIKLLEESETELDC